MTDLALAYEREQASGIGVFFPVTNRVLTVWGGAVDRTAAATNGFGAGFLGGLTATNFGGVEIFPVTLRTDDASGVIGFYNAGGSRSTRCRHARRATPRTDRGAARRADAPTNASPSPR